MISFKENQNLNKDYCFLKNNNPQMSALRYTFSNYPLDSGAQIEQRFSKFRVNKNHLRNSLNYIFLGLPP